VTCRRSVRFPTSWFERFEAPPGAGYQLKLLSQSYNGAVRPQQVEDLAPAHLKIDPVKSLVGAVILGQIFDFYNRCV
jgi:hypothetical protein